MYKKFVIALAVGALAIALHYLAQAGANTVIGDAYNSDAHTNINPPTTESVLGSYSCDKKTRCKNNYILSLKDDQVVEISSFVSTQSDATSTEETSSTQTQEKTLLTTFKGTWALATGGIILITLENQNDTTLEIPEKITIRKVDANKLSRLFFSKTSLFAKDMTSPIFERQN